jgi:hypothetical protein
MKNRFAAVRAIAVTVCLLTPAAACASNGGTKTTNSTDATSTTNELEVPNLVPFEVGARVGLPNGWTVQIAKVHRPYADPQLPALPDGRQYVALDLSVSNLGTTTENVQAADLFWLGDSTGKEDRVVAVPGKPGGVDGSYAPQTSRSGQLVFDVPLHAQLRMAMDGPLIGTQKAIFTVDPPTVPPSD